MRVNILVYPKSSQNKIVEFEDGLKVYMHIAARDGKANNELIRVLAKYYNVKKDDLKIILGKKNRRKVIEILKQ